MKEPIEDKQVGCKRGTTQELQPSTANVNSEQKVWMVYYINNLSVSAEAVRKHKQQQRVKFITLIMSQDLFSTDILVNV